MSRVSRSRRGSYQITEFGAALFLLFSLLIPLIDLAIIPLRYGLAKSMVSSRVHQLAQSDCISAAFKSFDQDETFFRQLKRIGGVNLRRSKLCLSVMSVKRPWQTARLDRSAPLPPEWLPDGAMSPCVYQLDLTVEADVEPLITARLFDLKVPGLTAPMPLQFRDVSAWENLGRDPSSGDFFLNI